MVKASTPYIMGEHIPLKFRESAFSEGNVKAMGKLMVLVVTEGRHK